MERLRFLTYLKSTQFALHEQPLIQTDEAKIDDGFQS